MYIVFVATNLQSVIAYHCKELDIHIYVAVLIIPIISLSFLKNLKILVPVSILAGILSVASKKISYKTFSPTD